MPPAYVAWRAGTSNRVVGPARQAGNWFLGSLTGLQIRAQLLLLAESIPWNRFLGSLNVYNFGLLSASVSPTGRSWILISSIYRRIQIFTAAAILVQGTRMTLRYRFCNSKIHYSTYCELCFKEFVSFDCPFKNSVRFIVWFVTDIPLLSPVSSWTA